MSLADIKNEVAGLKPEDRRHLMAFLLSLDGGLDSGLLAELTRKIEDKNPEHWVSLAEAKSRLGNS